MIYISSISEDCTALDLECVNWSAHLYSNCRSGSKDAISVVESS